LPNGYEKNWIRLCAALSGFRVRYGIWPSRVRISPVILDNLRQDLFSPEGFAKLEEKLQFIPGGEAFLVEDEEGRSYNYSLEGFPLQKPDVDPVYWLDTSPDIPD
jgi:hypothetical protein